jgi:hypothetical protein
MTLRDDILAQAHARQGLTYRLDPPPDGITTTDCSLLVRDSVRSAGAGNLPRTAEQQRQACTLIGWDDVKPGDLLFFEHTYDAAGPAGPDGKIASHVGFSMGRGTKRMFDAHERDGPDVGITDISTDYWQEHLFEARRIPAAAADDATAPPSMGAPWQWWSPEQLAAAAQCPVDAVQANWPRLFEQLGHCGLIDRSLAVGMIGTVAIESASTFRPVREAYYLGEPEPAESYRKKLRYYPYYGRGFIQNTWEDSYRELGPKIAALWGAGSNPAFDLIANPDNLLDPDTSAAAAAIFFRDKPGLVAAGKRGDWAEVRRLVYGGADPQGTARIATIASALSTVPAPPPVPIPPATDPRDAIIAQLRAENGFLRGEVVSLKADLGDRNSKLGAVAVDYAGQLRTLSERLAELKPT